jgi:hypothetical protein
LAFGFCRAAWWRTKDQLMRCPHLLMDSWMVWLRNTPADKLEIVGGRWRDRRRCRALALERSLLTDTEGGSRQGGTSDIMVEVVEACHVVVQWFALFQVNKNVDY